MGRGMKDGKGRRERGEGRNALSQIEEEGDVNCGESIFHILQTGNGERWVRSEVASTITGNAGKNNTAKRNEGGISKWRRGHLVQYQII